jgi:hypothetical protein
MKKVSPEGVNLLTIFLLLFALAFIALFCACWE